MPWVINEAGESVFDDGRDDFRKWLDQYKVQRWGGEEYIDDGYDIPGVGRVGGVQPWDDFKNYTANDRYTPEQYRALSTLNGRVIDTPVGPVWVGDYNPNAPEMSRDPGGGFGGMLPLILASGIGAAGAAAGFGLGGAPVSSALGGAGEAGALSALESGLGAYTNFGAGATGAAGGGGAMLDFSMLSDPWSFVSDPMIEAVSQMPSFGSSPFQSGFDLGNLGNFQIGADGSLLTQVVDLANGGMTWVPAAEAGLSGGSSILQQLNRVRSLLPNGGSGLIGPGGSLFDTNNLLGSGLDLAARTAPGMLALNYARSQDPIDTSRLESLYTEAADPNSNPALLSYDLGTRSGRNALTSSLTSRGVMGSSFGNFDLASYDTLRSQGRAGILGDTLKTRASIAGSLVDAQAKDRALKNQLYGRAFDVLGRGLSPGPTLYSAGY